jgi:phage terminase large subunit GpA-like protein
MKARDGSDSIMYKERIDGKGAIQISGANSPASLSQVTMKRQVQDDLAKWEMNNAGDPEVQADSRSQAHEFAKILKISTPLVDPGCRITKNFEDGSQEKLYLPCPHCGHRQALEWENFLANLDEEKPEDAHMSCVECGGLIEEHHRPGMLLGHRDDWRAANPKAKRFHRSFYLWSAYSTLQSFERIARSWLKARGDPASEQTFFNDVVGRAYRTLGEAPPWEALRDRASKSAYARGTVPAGFVIVTIGVDCQGDRVEYQVVGWGRDYRRAVIEYGVFPGHVSTKECREFLDGLVKQEWKNAYGQKLNVDLLAIDGNAWTEDVWGWAKRHLTSKVMMVRGVGSETAPLLARVKKERSSKTGKLLGHSRRFYNFATSVLKMGLYRNLTKEDPLERGFVGLPRGLDDEYFRQLTAESRRAKRLKNGFIAYEWVKDPTQANEGLDTHLQAEAAAIKFGVRSMPDAMWDKYEGMRECAPVSGQLDLEDLMNPAGTSPARPDERHLPIAVAAKTTSSTRPSRPVKRSNWMS